MFVEFAATTASRAPLYARLSAGIAEDPGLTALLLAAPPTQRQPVLLFACVHAQLLAEPDDELAAWYPNLAPTPNPDDPLPALRRFVARRREELERMLAERSTQTNEVGRCALFVLGLARLADEVGALAHVDVGTSAGLNLLLPRYQYSYEPGGTVGGPSPVRLTCGVQGSAEIPSAPPAIAAAVGIDRDPVDVLDDGAARWLEACVWPDQRDRFDRLRAAIELARIEARAGRLDVRRGDALAATTSTVAEVTERSGAHPVVTNSWVLSYFTVDERRAYVTLLDAIGAERDLSWLYVESPAQVEGLPVPPDDPTSELTALCLLRWRNGVRTFEHLADCHPHGYWLRWHIP